MQAFPTSVSSDPTLNERADNMTEQLSNVLYDVDSDSLSTTLVPPSRLVVKKVTRIFDGNTIPLTSMFTATSEADALFERTDRQKSLTGDFHYSYAHHLVMGAFSAKGWAAMHAHRLEVAAAESQFAFRIREAITHLTVFYMTGSRSALVSEIMTNLSASAGTSAPLFRHTDSPAHLLQELGRAYPDMKTAFEAIPDKLLPVTLQPIIDIQDPGVGSFCEKKTANVLAIFTVLLMYGFPCVNFEDEKKGASHRVVNLTKLAGDVYDLQPYRPSYNLMTPMQCSAVIRELCKFLVAFTPNSMYRKEGVTSDTAYAKLLPLFMKLAVENGLRHVKNLSDESSLYARLVVSRNKMLNAIMEESVKLRKVGLALSWGGVSLRKFCVAVVLAIQHCKRSAQNATDVNDQFRQLGWLTHCVLQFFASMRYRTNGGNANEAMYMVLDVLASCMSENDFDTMFLTNFQEINKRNITRCKAVPSKHQTLHYFKLGVVPYILNVFELSPESAEIHCSIQDDQKLQSAFDDCIQYWENIKGCHQATSTSYTDPTELASVYALFRDCAMMPQVDIRSLLVYQNVKSNFHSIRLLEGCSPSGLRDPIFMLRIAGGSVIQQEGSSQPAVNFSDGVMLGGGAATKKAKATKSAKAATKSAGKPAGKAAGKPAGKAAGATRAVARSSARSSATSTGMMSRMRSTVSSAASRSRESKRDEDVEDSDDESVVSSSSSSSEDDLQVPSPASLSSDSVSGSSSGSDSDSDSSHDSDLEPSIPSKPSPKPANGSAEIARAASNSLPKTQSVGDQQQAYERLERKLQEFHRTRYGEEELATNQCVVSYIKSRALEEYQDTIRSIIRLTVDISSEALKNEKAQFTQGVGIPARFLTMRVDKDDMSRVVAQEKPWIVANTGAKYLMFMCVLRDLLMSRKSATTDQTIPSMKPIFKLLKYGNAIESVMHSTDTLLRNEKLADLIGSAVLLRRRPILTAIMIATILAESRKELHEFLNFHNLVGLEQLVRWCIDNDCKWSHEDLGHENDKMKAILTPYGGNANLEVLKRRIALAMSPDGKQPEDTAGAAAGGPAGGPPVAPVNAEQIRRDSVRSHVNDTEYRFIKTEAQAKEISEALRTFSAELYQRQCAVQSLLTAVHALTMFIANGYETALDEARMVPPLLQQEITKLIDASRSNNNNKVRAQEFINLMVAYTEKFLPNESGADRMTNEFRRGVSAQFNNYTRMPDVSTFFTAWPSPINQEHTKKVFRQNSTKVLFNAIAAW